MSCVGSSPSLDSSDIQESRGRGPCIGISDFKRKEYFLLECGEIVIVHRDPCTDEPKSYRGPFSLHDGLMKLLQLFVKNANREMDVRTLCRELWPKEYEREVDLEPRLRKDIQRLRDELGDLDKALICKARGRVGVYVFSANVVEHSDFGDPTPVSEPGISPDLVPIAFFLPSTIGAREGAELREVILVRAQDLAFQSCWLYSGSKREFFGNSARTPPRPHLIARN